MLRSQCVREIVVKRLSALQKLSSMDNWPEVQKFLLGNGIRWFLLPPGEKPNWDPGLESAAFSINGFLVYDAGQSDYEIYKEQQC